VGGLFNKNFSTALIRAQVLKGFYIDRSKNVSVDFSELKHKRCRCGLSWS